MDVSFMTAQVVDSVDVALLMQQFDELDLNRDGRVYSHNLGERVNLLRKKRWRKTITGSFFKKRRERQGTLMNSGTATPRVMSRQATVDEEGCTD